jgi:hypothetical protein
LAAAEPPQGETAADGSARTGNVVTGELQLVVNAPDGSTAFDCPPGARPQVLPAAPDPTVRPRVTSGLLERDALCERLRGLLLQGRSVRLVGPQGSGRSAILDAVATACSGLAPAGVVRLTGYARTSGDLLQDLFAATHQAPGYRPGRALLPELLRDLCAVVVVDDVEFSGEALEELLAAAPESSFLITSTTAVATPLGAASPQAGRLEDTRLPGLSRQSSLALLARLAGRSLDDTERAWAVDLWFESEGLPLRFVQAAALLRHRESAIEAMAAGEPGPEWRGPAAIEAGDTEGASSGGALVPVREPAPGGFEAYLRQHGGDEEAPLVDPVPLPSVAESAAPAVRLARGLSTAGRRTLRLATALGGEIPSAPHLPALIDVGHGEEAVEELVEAGLATPVGSRHHRLVAGVAGLLTEEWPVDATADAAQHFAWWTGHASVTEEQIAAEAEVLLAVMHADREHGRHHQVVLLARRRPLLRAGSALGRLGAGAALRPGVRAGHGSGGRGGVVPPRTRGAGPLRGRVRPLPGRAGGLRRAARRARRQQGHRERTAGAEAAGQRRHAAPRARGGARRPQRGRTAPGAAVQPDRGLAGDPASDRAGGSQRGADGGAGRGRRAGARRVPERRRQQRVDGEPRRRRDHPGDAGAGLHGQRGRGAGRRPVLVHGDAHERPDDHPVPGPGRRAAAGSPGDHAGRPEQPEHDAVRDAHPQDAVQVAEAEREQHDADALAVDCVPHPEPVGHDQHSAGRLRLGSTTGAPGSPRRLTRGPEARTQNSLSLSSSMPRMPS